MAVPKKRRSKSKKRFKKECWKKKAEIQTKKIYSIYKNNWLRIQEKNGDEISNSVVSKENKL